MIVHSMHFSISFFKVFSKYRLANGMGIFFHSSQLQTTCLVHFIFMQKGSRKKWKWRYGAYCTLQLQTLAYGGIHGASILEPMGAKIQRQWNLWVRAPRDVQTQLELCSDYIQRVIWGLWRSHMACTGLILAPKVKKSTSGF